MNYIRITEANIDKEHICCAMSGKQGEKKKAWMKERFAEGLVFYRSEERGKCFIEYIPAENAWVPIDAPEYLYINCLWIAGSMKGHGYSNDLLAECIRDAAQQGKKGLCILSSEKRKKEFLADPKYLTYKGFRTADTSDCGIILMYLPLCEDAPVPQFRDCAKHPIIAEKGFVIYYTDQCPLTYYWVPRVAEEAAEHGIEIKTVHITDKKTAQNMPAPVTTYALFKDGKFVTQAIQSDKMFFKLAGIDAQDKK
ncbi:MAG: YoaP domain-containing protein [Oscillospiraceae bacterium]|nr:YoaP domain-containing protein [Oscillospiraceae bacterium]